MFSCLLGFNKGWVSLLDGAQVVKLFGKKGFAPCIKIAPEVKCAKCATGRSFTELAGYRNWGLHKCGGFHPFAKKPNLTLPAYLGMLTPCADLRSACGRVINSAKAAASTFIPEPAVFPPYFSEMRRLKKIGIWEHHAIRRNRHSTNASI
ncbi:hypothetical protein AAKU58_002936 [Oxalobacteraceae bacterium GrIS 1.18]